MLVVVNMMVFVNNPPEVVLVEITIQVIRAVQMVSVDPLVRQQQDLVVQPQQQDLMTRLQHQPQHQPQQHSAAAVIQLVLGALYQTPQEDIIMELVVEQ